jgi:serine/threonine protein kinase
MIYALKRVRLQNKDTEAIKGFIDEIGLLRQLRNRPNIIQLIDAQVGERACGGIGEVHKWALCSWVRI